MRNPTKLLAVASAGGHWVQLNRAMAAFDGFRVVYVTTALGDAPAGAPCLIQMVPDANRTRPLQVVRLAVAMLRILLRERPDVVFSTGAAPGCIAVVFGRLLGIRTIWLDSIANVECMSLSGRLVRPFAGLWLTQWPELARPNGPEYGGRIY